MRVLVGMMLLVSATALPAQQVQTDCTRDMYGNVQCQTKRSPYSSDFSLEHWQQPVQTYEPTGEGIYGMQSAWEEWRAARKAKKERKRLEAERKALEANPFADLIPQQP